MLKIFAALKVLVAKTGSSLGAVAAMAIRDNFIPRLEKELDSESDPVRQEKIQETLKRWKSAMGSSRWEYMAHSMVETAAAGWHRDSDPDERTLGPSFADDIEQETAYVFFSDQRMKTVFEKFDPMGGPKAFVNYWNAVLRNAVSNTARKFLKEEPEHHFGERGGPDEIPARKESTELDERAMQDAKAGLDRYIAEKFSGGRHELERLVYQTWMDAAAKSGAGSVFLSRDVLPVVYGEMKDKGFSISSSTVYNAWNDVAKTIARYFRNELGMPLSNRTKRNLKLAERLAYSEYRRRLAAWVLGRGSDNSMIFAHG